MAQNTITLQLTKPEQTDALGASLAEISRAGDCILLQGQIGAGKSALARAFIRHRFGQDTDVPSPTFTLVQTYEDKDVDIWHADLYRLSDPQEAVELGLIDAFELSICLIEWPEILGDLAPSNSLDIQLTVTPNAHVAQLSFDDTWGPRLKALRTDAD